MNIRTLFFYRTFSQGHYFSKLLEDFLTFFKPQEMHEQKSKGSYRQELIPRQERHSQLELSTK